jgi:hypothetical protein
MRASVQNARLPLFRNSTKNGTPPSYDYTEVCEQVQAFGWSAHIRIRGEEKQAKREIPGYRARRWVVERTHSWMNRFRRLLTRWEKKTENFRAMLHFACAWQAYRAAGVAV